MVLNGTRLDRRRCQARDSSASLYQNVVNVLRWPTGRGGSPAVKFAEVDRSAVNQLESMFFSSGAGNVVGTLRLDNLAHNLRSGNDPLSVTF